MCLPYVEFIQIVDFSCALRFEYRYQGENLTFECRLSFIHSFIFVLLILTGV